MATASPKIVRFDDYATVYEEELSDTDSDSAYVENLDAGSYFESSLSLPPGYYGSPFDLVCQIVEGVYAHGDGLVEAFVGCEAKFEVDTNASPGKELLVTIRDSHDKDVACNVTNQPHGDYLVTYVPEKSGLHSVEVLYDGVNIHSSPFSLTVRKPRVYVEDFPTCAYVGKINSFRIDAHEMKKGTLEIDSSLPVKYHKLSQNAYRITFVPKRVGKHDMVIKYNGEEIEGCPYRLEVKQITKQKRRH